MKRRRWMKDCSHVSTRTARRAHSDMKAALLFTSLVLSVFAGPINQQEDFQPEDEAEQYQDLQQVPEQQEEMIDIFETDKPIGDASGLAMDPNGNLVAFHRADRHWDEYTFNKDQTFNKSLGTIDKTTIAVITPAGKVIEEFGSGEFYLPHGLTIDNKGNLWVTDVGAHQIHKIDGKTKKIVLTLGEKLVPGEDEKHFCQPTDIAVASNGHFFVADGYCNSRVLKFDSNGKLIAQINAALEDGESTDFIVPHSVTLVEDMNLLCVADRENERVQCFSAGLAEGLRRIPTGIPITSANHIGRVFAIRERNHYLIGATSSDAEESIEAQLFVMDMQTGKTDTFAKGIETAHAIAIAADGDVYVSQIQPSRIVKLTLAN